jgi:hypothetical protein
MDKDHHKQYIIASAVRYVAEGVHIGGGWRIAGPVTMHGTPALPNGNTAQE